MHKKTRGLAFNIYKHYFPADFVGCDVALARGEHSYLTQK